MHLNGRPFDREDLPAVRALFRGEVVTREEFNMVVGDSAPRRLCVSTTPVRGSDGVIIAAVGVVEDITGLRAQEAEQQRLPEEERLAKAAAKAQAEFIANMNHELRTPGEGWGRRGVSVRLHGLHEPRDADARWGLPSEEYQAVAVLSVIFTPAVHGILGLCELLMQSISHPGEATTPGGASRLSEAELLASQLEYCSSIRDCATLLQSLVSSVLDSSKVRGPVELFAHGLGVSFRSHPRLCPARSTRVSCCLSRSLWICSAL